MRRSTVRELGRGWSSEQGGAVVARLKKEGGGEATDERARAVSGGASDAERGGALGSGARVWAGAGRG